MLERAQEGLGQLQGRGSACERSRAGFASSATIKSSRARARVVECCRTHSAVRSCACTHTVSRCAWQGARGRTINCNAQRGGVMTLIPRQGWPEVPSTTGRSAPEVAASRAAQARGDESEKVERTPARRGGAYGSRSTDAPALAIESARRADGRWLGPGRPSSRALSCESVMLTAEHTVRSTPRSFVSRSLATAPERGLPPASTVSASAARWGDAKKDTNEVERMSKISRRLAPLTMLTQRLRS